MISKAVIKYVAVFSFLLQLAGLQHGAMASQSAVQEIDTDAFANVYFIPDQNRPTLRAYLIFNKGELHNSGVEGLAHYVEHLAWLNTRKESGSSRHSNAWTNLYSTGYWVEFDSADYKSQLQSLLQVVEPWTIDERFMLEERAVIEQEYNKNYLGDPYLSINLERKRTLLGDTAFARSVIGTPHGIRAFDLDDARRLHQATHQLKNATLLISGKSSPEQLAQWLDTLKLPSTEQKSGASSPPDIALSAVVSDRDVDSHTIPESTLYYEKLVQLDGCGSPAQCDAVFWISRSVIDSTLPGGIANALRFDNFIARSFTFGLYKLTDSHAVMRFVAEPDIGVSLETLENAFNEAWSTTADGGIPEESFDRARKRILDGMDTITDKPSQALGIILGQLQLGEPVYSPEEQVAALSAVDYAQAMKLLKKIHDDDGRVVVRRVSKVTN